MEITHSDNVVFQEVLLKCKVYIQGFQNVLKLNERSSSPERVDKVVQRLRVLEKDKNMVKQIAENCLDELENREQELTDELVQKQQEQLSFIDKKLETITEKEAASANLATQEANLAQASDNYERSLQEEIEAQHEYDHRKERVKKFKKNVFHRISGAVGAGPLPGQEHKLRKAKEHKQRVSERKNEGERAVSEAKKIVADLNAKIEQYKTQAADLQSKLDQCHKKIGLIKSTMSLLKKSEVFWAIFNDKIECLQDRLQLLMDTVRSAGEEGSYEIMQEDGTIKLTQSLFEAWENLQNSHFKFLN